MILVTLRQQTIVLPNTCELAHQDSPRSQVASSQINGRVFEFINFMLCIRTANKPVTFPLYCNIASTNKDKIVYVTGQPRSGPENLIRFNIFEAPSRSDEAWWRHPSSGAQEFAFDPSFLAVHRTDLGTLTIPFSFVGARRGRRRNGQPLIIAAKKHYRRLFFQ